MSTHSDPQDGKQGSKSDIKDPKNNGNQGSKEKGDEGSGGSGSHDANDAHGSKPDKVKENNGQGSAYGKEKTLEGRDFGQQRAEEASKQSSHGNCRSGRRC
ncbi:MAG: hypothetical protein IPN95_31710 [Bacteroidetes bacterium]|nr:hypothetical protein [Bacteroidota bacterium]